MFNFGEFYELESDMVRLPFGSFVVCSFVFGFVFRLLLSCSSWTLFSLWFNTNTISTTPTPTNHHHSPPTTPTSIRPTTRCGSCSSSSASAGWGVCWARARCTSQNI
jgi:hypothetical protein